MAYLTRSIWRNAHIYHLSAEQCYLNYTCADKSRLIGGLWVAPGTQNWHLYAMVESLCTFSDHCMWGLYYGMGGGPLVDRDSGPLRPGDYFLVTQGSVTVTEEVPLLPTISAPDAIDSSTFTKTIRERDRRCILTRRPARMARYGDWVSFEATHVFPLAYEGQWNDLGYSKWITIPPKLGTDRSINSLQNGILLSTTEHHLFTSYCVSIDPDDNYRIVCFAPETLELQLTGHYLDREFVEDPLRPVDDVLRWHYRQALLVNVRGTGEPFIDTVFP